MKIILLFLVLISGTLAFPGIAVEYPGPNQTTDTLEISDAGKCYIIMPDEIQLFDFGSNKDKLWLGEIVQNVVKIKAVSPAAPTTTLWVATVKREYKLFIIKYKKNPKQWQYDYGTPPVVAAPKEEAPQVPTLALSDQEMKNKIDLKIIKKRKLMVAEEKEKISSVGVAKNNIVLSVVNVKNDNYATYIKLKISNNSSVDYVIDAITFSTTEKLKASDKTKKDFFNKNNVVENDITPLIDTPLDKISAYDKTTVVYALPLFATGDGTASALRVTLREVKGTRKIIVDVPIKYIVKAEVF